MQELGGSSSCPVLFVGAKETDSKGQLHNMLTAEPTLPYNPFTVDSLDTVVAVLI